MSWVFTGQNLPDGRPVFQCPDCKRRIWGWKIASHACNGKIENGPSGKLIPCLRRGLAFKKVVIPGCDCRVTIYECGSKGFCASKKVDELVNNIIPAVCSEQCDQFAAYPGSTQFPPH